MRSNFLDGRVAFMKKIIVLFLALLACRQPPVSGTFADKEGCFLLYNLKTNRFQKVIGSEFCKVQLPACSTFKIPLALMAFDSGALKDENEELAWDGERREFEEWNHSQNAKSWISNSVVWVSQRLTQKMGETVVSRYLRQFSYGNEDISGGLTNAWLVSPASSSPALRISAFQQIEFLKRLYTGHLGVSERAQELTKSLLILETAPGSYVLSGKTGSGTYNRQSNVRLGWFVGAVSNESGRYLFATVFRDRFPSGDSDTGGKRAKEITGALLKAEGL